MVPVPLPASPAPGGTGPDDIAGLPYCLKFSAAAFTARHRYLVPVGRISQLTGVVASMERQNNSFGLGDNVDLRPRPVLCARKLNRAFYLGAAIYAVHDLDLDVYPGEFVVVRGPSGSGKSTMLSLMAGLDRPTSGRITVDGQDLNDLSEAELADLRRRKIGYVFQFFNLIGHLNARQNVVLPMAFTPAPQWYVDQRAQELLELVGLTHRADHLPGQLSGGEQQRVAIARALANTPSVLLADEPTGNLDRRTATQISGVFHRINEEYGQTCVMVTHDPELAAYAHRVISMADGTVVDIAPGGRGR